jgi:hypothetical protein
MLEKFPTKSPSKLFFDQARRDDVGVQLERIGDVRVTF